MSEEVYLVLRSPGSEAPSAIGTRPPKTSKYAAKRRPILEVISPTRPKRSSCVSHHLYPCL